MTTEQSLEPKVQCFLINDTGIPTRYKLVYPPSGGPEAPLEFVRVPEPNGDGNMPLEWTRLGICSIHLEFLQTILTIS